MKFILKRINLLLCCIILLSQLTGKLYAQQYYRAIVKISRSPVDITNLARTIATQTGLEYSLNMQNASLKKMITLRAGTWQLSDILREVRQQAGLNYKIIGDHILFMDYEPGGNKRDAKTVVKYDPPVAKKERNTTTSLVVIKKKSNPPVISKVNLAPKVGIYSVKSNTNKTSTTTAGTSGTTNNNQIEQGLISATEERAGPMFDLPKHSIWTNATNVKASSLLRKLPEKDLFASLKKSSISLPKDNTTGPAKKEKDEWHKVFVKAGLSADEILYMNASLMAGIKYVYGIVSYGTTFAGGRFRFGLGVPVKLNEEQQLHFNFTTGIPVKSRIADSIPISAAVKENLYRYGVAWSKTYNQRWTLQLQVHYNVLKRTSDTTHALSDYNHFYYANPPYALSKGASTRTDTRTWIGAQIAIYYTLF
jgi:hypothetical protein